MIYNVFSFLHSIITFTLICFFVEIFLPRRFSLLWLYGTGILISSGVLFLINKQEIPLLNTLSSLCLSMAMAGFLFKGKLLRRFLIGCVAICLSVACEFLSMGITAALLGRELNEVSANAISHPEFGIFSTSVFYLIVTGIRMWRRRKTKCVGSPITVPIHSTTIILPFFSVFLLYYVFFVSAIAFPGKIPVWLNIFLIMILFSANVFGVVGDRSMHKVFNLRIELEKMNRQQEYQHALCKQQEQDLETIHAKIHDFKNQLIGLQSMLQSRNYEDQQMLQLIDETYGSLETEDKYQGVRDNVLRTFLRLTSARCKQQNIDFQVVLEYYRLNNIEYPDLATLLSNTFDNAIEAAGNGNISKPYVLFEAYKAGQMQILRFKNTKSHAIQKEGDSFLSTKNPPLGHGIGIKNIQRIASKNGGIATFRYTEDVFCVLIALPLGNPT